MSICMAILVFGAGIILGAFLTVLISAYLLSAAVDRATQAQED